MAEEAVRRSFAAVLPERELLSMTDQKEQRPYVHVPVTFSPQAQAFLGTLPDPALILAFPGPHDLAGWTKLQAWAEADGRTKSEPLLMRYPHTAMAGKLGGVPIVMSGPRTGATTARSSSTPTAALTSCIAPHRHWAGQ